MFFGWYFDWTILIVIPAMLFGLWAQLKVSMTFNKYSQEATRRNYTGADAARRLLDANGLSDVAVDRVPGELTDHYDPRSRKLFLSESVYDSRSAAAIGVACHEAGHAIQHAHNYAPLNLRMQIIPICRFGSGLAMPLFLIGLLIGSEIFGTYLMMAGIACFAVASHFQVVTLPVEFNASKRALEGIREAKLLDETELPMAKKVLTAAAMTYVAALISSLLSLLRLILIANRRR